MMVSVLQTHTKLSPPFWPLEKFSNMKEKLLFPAFTKTIKRKCLLFKYDYALLRTHAFHLSSSIHKKSIYFYQIITKTTVVFYRSEQAKQLSFMVFALSSRESTPQIDIAAVSRKVFHRSSVFCSRMLFIGFFLLNIL